MGQGCLELPEHLRIGIPVTGHPEGRGITEYSSYPCAMPYITNTTQHTHHTETKHVKGCKEKKGLSQISRGFYHQSLLRMTVIPLFLL
jgi:hypothetical protein